MCNLYAFTTAQDAIRRLFKTEHDRTGNLPPLPAIYPDALAPVVTAQAGVRTLEMMRWGFPPPPRVVSRPVTNIRNATSPYWQPWFAPNHRCLVPVTSFCEWTDSLPKTPVWFALGEDRPAFAFAGVWRPWTGTRGTKANPATGEHRVFSFLTTNPNETVRPIHAKAMPVILREDEWSVWLEAPVAHALRLQTPLPDGELRVVATGVREDCGPDGASRPHIDAGDRALA